MKNYLEDSVLNKVDRERRPAVLDTALTKAEKIIDLDRIKENEFKDLYTEKTVQENLDYVDEMQNKFQEQHLTAEEREAAKLAQILEAMIHEQGEINYWLGKDAKTIKTSRYDDIKNGVDEIVEYQQPDSRNTSHLALAVDVTCSENLYNLLEKMNKIKSDIDAGQLSLIKYFKSEFLKNRGEKSDIAKVIVGVDKGILNEAVDLWLENKNKRLADHPVKYLILDEILTQLRSFKSYALKVEQPKVVQAIDDVLKIAESKINQVIDPDIQKRVMRDYGDDKVYSMIKRYCQVLNSDKVKRGDVILDLNGA